MGLARRLRSFDPKVTYLVDLAVAPLMAWLLANRPGSLIVDTGDAPRDFLALVSAGRMKVWAASMLERTGYGMAKHVVVRGPFHQVELRRRGYECATVVPDGVDLDIFTPRDASSLRMRLGFVDTFVVGLQGHFTWYASLGGGLGWEAVSALQHVKDLPVHVVLIGDGPGIPKLRELAAELHVEDRLHALGRVETSALPDYLALCDVFLLTQTNDPSSWVRTTGKLPCYLSMARPVLASDVGTASTLLPAELLLPYEGKWDTTYPQRLADRLRALQADSRATFLGESMRPLAARFDYGTVARQAADIALRALA